MNASGPNTYRVLLPYTETPNIKKRFTVEYTVEAADRRAALVEAEKEFYAYTRYNSASWVRMLQPEGIRIWRLMPDLPQTPASIDALVENLAQSDTDVLYNTLRALGDLEDQTAARAVAGLMNHSDAEIAALAVETLGRLGDVGYVDDILSRFDDKATARMRACVLSALGRLGKVEHTRLQDVLSRALGDDDTRVRANAVELVERLQLPDAPRVLVPLMGDEDNRVRANVLKALWNSHDRETLVTALEEMVKASNHWMRASAAFVLRYLDVENRYALVGRLLRDSDAEVRASAVKTLMVLDDVEQVVPLLVEVQAERSGEFGEQITNRMLALGSVGWARLLSWQPPSPKADQVRRDWMKRIEDAVHGRDGHIAWMKMNLRRWLGR